MKEDAITREDRFHGQFYEALLKELREIKALLKEEKQDESECTDQPKPRSRKRHAE